MDDLTNPEAVIRNMSDEDLLARINGFDQYDVEFARRFRALSAALEQARAVKVKPLDWGRPSEHQVRAKVDTGACEMVCTFFGSKWHHEGEPYPDLDAAKAAAQAHHEARVLAMLDMGGR